MKGAVVNSKWFAWHPYRRMDARYWLEVANLVKTRRIPRDDRAAVTEVILEVEYKFSKEPVK